jgi:hypothetical protein
LEHSEVRRVDGAALGLQARPHGAEPHDVESDALEEGRVLGAERETRVEGVDARVPRRPFENGIHAVEESLAARLVDEHVGRRVHGHEAARHGHELRLRRRRRRERDERTQQQHSPGRHLERVANMADDAGGGKIKR